MRNAERPLRTVWAVLLATALAACAHAGPAENRTDAQSERALRATLDAHLAAINARDLDRLLSTVTQEEALTTILPNGKVLSTREDYRLLHVDWFRDPAWRMVFAVEELRVLGDTGIARVRYDSQSKGADGAYASMRIAQLTLVFARERGQWRLVYDQNTVVESAVVPTATP